ncbi:UBE2J2 isoform 6, partial [Pan troglodytes]
KRYFSELKGSVFRLGQGSTFSGSQRRPSPGRRRIPRVRRSPLATRVLSAPSVENQMWPQDIAGRHYVVRGPEMTPYEGIPVLDHLQLGQPECRSTSVGWALHHRVIAHDQRWGCQQAVVR